ncbi:uncharacterized protein LOC117653754 isoform X2 [Thrips palmi]|uniref:Uncharacterized protein LOC117653754 isoform X2 n=1 Tax=Thrips palmi TaxID=161013 RepID=A0A6P9ABK0_THRPL|nr:uncharacterized protein LOC117653754 isoform X2 [Thrips palmi]
MADPNSALGPLPNGWECRNDPRTRRNYFINFINKTTTWDDPRVNPSIVHAPPPYNEPTTDIFTMQDISSYRPSPVPGRVHTAPLMGSHAIGHHSSSKIHETSFSTAVATEHSVAKISAMFPTVSETHIRALLIKYHSREAVVISALQVEKNPITTPGPFSTPPLSRHIIIPPSVLPPNYHSTPPPGLRDFASTPPPSLYSYGYGTGGTLTGSLASSSCMGSPAFRHSPRPHSSPKMKLRYMKSMFPKADETIILDTLYNVENNVAAATNQLQAMGFDKKDSTPSCGGTPSSKGKETEKSSKNEKKEKAVPTPTPSARLRSVVEKQEMRDRLKKVHPDLAEQLISMALDSVDYDENRASHILNIMIKDEVTPKSTQPNSASSSQRPQSSNKSNDAEVSSMGTKTTVEADIAAGTAHKLTIARETEDELSRNEQSTVEVVVSSEKTTDTKESAVEIKGPSSKTVSTSATIHCPPNKSSSNETSQSPKSSSAKKTKGKKGKKVSRGTSTTEDKEYRSAHRLRAAGPNSSLHHGPNDELLLEDYVTWAGPSRQTKGSFTTAIGPNKNLLRAHRYSAKGPNREACKGPQKGLAKGSLYSHLAACNAATTLVAVESRGK